jgi:uncharacterized protein (TIGR03382 family)
MLRLVIVSVLASVLALFAAPRVAAACSIANDEAPPPEVELPYDSAKSPAAPVVVEARIAHNDDDGPGCVASSCGPFSGLSLTLDVDAGTTLVRIDFADRPHMYANVWSGGDGTAYIFLPGFGDADALPLTLRAIDENGYTSQATSHVAYSDAQDDAGCSASGKHSNAALVLLAGLLVFVRRRRSGQLA